MTQFRPLTSSDVPSAKFLSTQAGWNQLDADWQRLITLWPETCVGGFNGSSLVATGTLATYGVEAAPPIAWIGMILVDEGQRGKGLGTGMMKMLLVAAKQRHVKTVGLDATDMGKPVYEKLGFVTHSIVNRWMATAGTTTAPPHNSNAGHARPMTPEYWPAAELLDKHAVAVSRHSLLRLLQTEEGADTRVVLLHGRVSAIGFSREGRTAKYIGPIVASDPESAAIAFRGLFHRMPTGTRVLIDVPENSPLCDSLRDAGFVIQRRLTRMLLPLEPSGEPQSLMSDMVYSGAGFELG